MSIKIPTYERSVNLDSGAQTIPRIHAADDVGKALSKSGDAMISVAAKQRQQQERFENFQMAQKQAQAQQAVQQIIFEEQQKYDPMKDPPGTMYNRIKPRVDDVYNKLGIGAPERLQPYYAEHANTAMDHVTTTVAKSEVQIINSTYTKQLDGLAGSFRKQLEVNPDGFQASSKLMLDSIARSGLPRQTQDAMAQGYMQGLAQSTVKGFNTQGRFNDAKSFVDNMQDLTVPQVQPKSDFRSDNSPTAPSPQNAQFAMKFFMDKGLSKADAAAFVWNFQQESGKNINPALVHDNGTGYGIAGFRDPSPGSGRRTSLFNFAGTNQPGLLPQLEYAWQELQGPENKTFRRVLAADTPEQKAAAAIGYFRPRADFAANRASRAGEVRGLINATPDPATPAEEQTAQGGDGKGKVAVDPSTGKMTLTKPTQVADATSVAAFTGTSLTDTAPPGAVQPITSKTHTPANPGPWALWAEAARADIDAASNKAAAKDTSMKRKLDSVINSDVASVSQTGKPVKLSQELAQYYGTDQLSPELVEKALGQGKAVDWLDRRDDAQRLFAATDGMDNEPAEGIANRLDTLMPKGGEQDYAARMKTFENATRLADQIFRSRMSDPAAAADRLPEVRAALDKARAAPNDTQAAQELTDARMKGQEFLGIPESQRAPITQQEAAQIAIPLIDRANPNQPKAQEMAIRGLSQIVGNDPALLQKALGVVLAQKGIKDQQAQELAAQMQAFVSPAAPQPTNKAQQKTFYEGFGFGTNTVQLSPTGDFYKDESALSPSDPRFSSERKQFMPGKEMMSPDHVKTLRDNPGLKSEFDDTYGEGASKWVFDQAKTLNQHSADPAQATGFSDPGTDPYQPSAPDDL